MKKRFSEEQIIRFLQEAESGMSARDLCRKHEISEQTFYRWKAKYGGMEVDEAKRLRWLERQNEELKKLVADLTLDNRMLREINKKSGDAVEGKSGRYPFYRDGIAAKARGIGLAFGEDGERSLTSYLWRPPPVVPDSHWSAPPSGRYTP